MVTDGCGYIVDGEAAMPQHKIAGFSRDRQVRDDRRRTARLIGMVESWGVHTTARGIS